MGDKKPQNHPPETTCPCRPLINAIGHKDKNAKIPQKRFWRDREPIEKYTFWIAIFTFIYSVVSIGLYLNSRENMIISQRAWVVNDKMNGSASNNINNTGNGGKVIYPNWFNSGNTPTRNLRIYTAAIVRTEKSIDKNYKFSIPEEIAFTPAVIGPKGFTFGGPNIVTSEDLENVKNSKIVLTFWGEVTYKDIFPNTPLHVTKFCQETAGLTWNDPKRLWDQSTLQFKTCVTHNCIDKECDNQ